MFRTWGELETIYDVSPQWRLYGKFRLIGDNADNLDSRLRNFDNFPNDFRGNGWMLRGENKHVSFEARELYTDIKMGNLSLRLGKQQIVWGETIAGRLLDVVNPLDITHLFAEPWKEEFDNTRIPQWFLRATYTVPNRWIDDFNIEMVFNPGDVVPTLLPAQGSPYNLVPTFVTINDRVPRGKIIGGGRLLGKISDVNFSLAYLTKPVDDAIAVGVPPFAVLDCKFGLPVGPGPCPGGVLALRFINEGIHPRVHIIGGSANYYYDPLGAVFRAETTYTPDQPYQKTPPLGSGVTSITRRDTWKLALTIDRPTQLIPGLDPTQILSLTYFQTVIGGKPRGIQIISSRVSKTTEQLAFTLSQPFYRKQLFFNFLSVYDFDDASWFQPGIQYVHGDHWRFDLFTNVFTGAEKRPGRFGSLKFANEVAFRVTWGF
jgi:hypothetical protein